MQLVINIKLFQSSFFFLSLEIFNKYIKLLNSFLCSNKDQIPAFFHCCLCYRAFKVNRSEISPDIPNSQVVQLIAQVFVWSLTFNDRFFIVFKYSKESILIKLKNTIVPKFLLVEFSAERS
jgi:hypothetical protein